MGTPDVATDMAALGADIGQGWLRPPAVSFAAVTELLDRQVALADR